MSEFRVLEMVINFLKKNEVEYTEIHFEQDNYSKMQIGFDLSNGINVDIQGRNGDIYMIHNTTTSDKYCDEIKIDNEEQLQKILNKLKGGI